MESILTTPYNGSKVFDFDAQRFLSATGITDTDKIIAVNELCLTLKMLDLWDKKKLIAVILGGTMSSVVYNLKDATPILGLNGGLTVDDNGIHGNAVDGYIDLDFKASDFDQNSFCFSIYNSNPVASNMLIGLASPRVELFLDGPTYYAINEMTEASVTTATSKALYSVSRNSDGTVRISIDGEPVGSATTTSSAPNNIDNICALARNNNGTKDNFSNGVISFIMLGEELSIAEQRKEWIAVQQFEINLGRNF